MSDLDILISVHKRYVSQMLSGNKTVELRRRAVHLKPGSRVWIYTTAPIAAVEALGVVSTVVLASPSVIWETYRGTAGVSSVEFENYFRGLQTGCAIVFEKVLRLKNAVPLAALRKKVRTFHPPQFFKRLPHGSKELQAIVETQCAGIVWAGWPDIQCSLSGEFDHRESSTLLLQRSQEKEMRLMAGRDAKDC